MGGEGPGRGGGGSGEFLVGVCAARVSKSSLFPTKTGNFPHPFSDHTSKIHTHFQPLGGNNVIIT